MSAPLSSAKPSGQRTKADPPSQAANSQQRGKKGTQQPIANTKATTKKASSAPPEKWVVVIRNVENDFARVHQHALERYCCLNRAAAASAAATPTAEPAKSASPEVYYTAKPRTETRSVEFCVYAPSADADISSVWTPVTVGSSATNDLVDEQAATGADPTPQATTATLASAPRFSSVDDMVSVLKCKPYFTYPPLFVTGADAAVSSDSETSRKRTRDEEVDATEEADEPAGPRTLRGVKQASLVTVHVVSSSVTSQRNLKKVLSSVPGFVTAWALYPLHFRVVFSGEEALFRAKSLLDQFEAEGLRLTVTLPDGLSRKYDEFLALQADE